MSNDSMLISDATRRNWEKLHTEGFDKLKCRANKSLSKKRIVPDNYIHRNGLDSIARQLMSCTHSNRDIFYCLCMQKLNHLPNNINIKRFASEYRSDVNIEFDLSDEVLSDTKRDWIGFLYQMRTPEGQRNIQGQYYTNFNVVNKMLSDVHLDHNQSFFDPCCGTGAFLMNVGAESLSQLYGVDNDEIAVMIAKANLIALYPDDIHYPRIYCEDYLDDTIFATGQTVDLQFDYIYTNPPWGICKTHQYRSDVIHSGERAALFFVKAFRQLKPEGYISFLLPSSLLKIKVHQDFRSFILRKTGIESISLYNERFNGVFTDFFSITATKKNSVDIQSYYVKKNEQLVWISKPVTESDTEIELNSLAEQEILAMVDARGFYNLKESVWALGVVTGDNKNKLKKEKTEGYEPIYTGKDIGRYSLRNPSNYILYDRTQLQQCAKDEYYRCSEKLVYKFISKSLCFAYDNSSSLFLNSANILIPRIKGLSIKTVLAFLNSELFSYYYSKKFTDIKILKGNLMALPFPEITEQQNAEISDMVDSVLKGEQLFIEKINDYIYSLYGFSPTIVSKIKKALHGNVDFSA